jgi:hypothetical protein
MKRMFFYVNHEFHVLILHYDVSMLRIPCFLANHIYLIQDYLLQLILFHYHDNLLQL